MELELNDRTIRGRILWEIKCGNYDMGIVENNDYVLLLISYNKFYLNKLALFKRDKIKKNDEVYEFQKIINIRDMPIKIKNNKDESFVDIYDNYKIKFSLDKIKPIKHFDEKFIIKEIEKYQNLIEMLKDVWGEKEYDFSDKIKDIQYIINNLKKYIEVREKEIEEKIQMKFYKDKNETDID